MWKVPELPFKTSERPVRIMKAKADCLLKSKSEFHQAPLVRVVALTGLQEEQEDRAGANLEVREARQQGGRGRGLTGRGRASGRGAGTGEAGGGGGEQEGVELGQGPRIND